MDEEIRKKRTLYGIQKDDLVFTLNNRPLKRFGSQGQVKSFLYALRLASLSFH